MAVTLSIDLPDDIVAQLSAGGRNLQRAALEAFAVEEYRGERLSHAQLGKLRGISRWAVENLLKEHEAWLDYGVEDFRAEGLDFEKARNRENNE